MQASLYGDMMSQPTRACALFCRVNNLDVKEVPVLIHKAEHRGEEYLKRNPLSRVPMLEEVSQGTGEPFRLPESCAILSYLADTRQVPEHWLPRSDRRARARVEAAMHWQHLTIRAGEMRVVFNKVLAKRLGVKPNEAIAHEGLVILKRALDDLNKAWLEGGRNAFMCGDQICVADLLVCCELEQLTLLNKERDGVDMEGLLAPHPAVSQWIGRVAEATHPHYEQVHAMLRRSARAAQGCASPAEQTQLSNTTQGLASGGPQSKL